jgi:lipopolysaccharide export LptBFGC system permease protein LptF
LDLASLEATGFELLQLSSEGKDQEKTYAVSARYRAADGIWELSSVKHTIFRPDGTIEKQENLPTLTLPHLGTSPDQLVAIPPKPETMTLSEIGSFLAQPTLPANLKRAPYATQWHSLLAQPTAVFVLLLFALALGNSPVRGNPSVGVFNSIFILIAFLFTTHLFLAMGRGERLPALLAAWITPVLFLGIASLLLCRQFGGNFIPNPLRKLFSRA